MRKPFDPLLIPEPKDEASAKPLAVAELTRRIRNALEARFGRVWVVGEISNLSRPSSGHIYFSLKDLASAVNCVMWRAKAAKVKCTVTDGLEVEVRGRLTVYEPQGRYQIVVDSIKPRGVGALEVAFRKLKERLAGEGLFESERKRPLPCFPGCIGIVTSPTGAAVRDIIHVTGRRWPQARLVLAPVRVQGEGAAEEIAQAIADLNRLGGVDVMIVGRGGGSLEDLWPFNEEVVAREIYTSEIPVISAVGHETDFSISDCVADVRAPTPSAAAEIVVPNAKELLRHLASAEQHLFSYITSEAERAGNRLAIISGSRYFKYPRELVATRAQMADDLAGRMVFAARHVLSGARLRVAGLVALLAKHAPRVQYERRLASLQLLCHRLRASERTSVIGRRKGLVAHLSDRLDDLGPMKVLRRGYSLTTIARTGQALLRAKDARPGQQIHTRLAEGEIDSRVTGEENRTLFDDS